MNIIISNKYDALLNTITIDTLERVNGTFSVDELSERFKNVFFNKMVIDITAIKGYEDITTIQQLTFRFQTDKLILLLDDSSKVNDSVYLSQLVSMGIYNFTKDVNQVPYLIDNTNTYKDVANFQILDMSKESNKDSERAKEQANSFAGQKVLGVVNLTPHAGATTLSYLLAKHISTLYKVKGVELGNSDFVFFQESELLDSIAGDNLKNYIETHKEQEVIVVDLAENTEENRALCTDVIYLLEAGLIQLNKLIGKQKRIFEEMYDKKLVINRSILNSRDIQDFERESGCRIFFNIPNIDDKLDNIKCLKELLLSLGFTRFNNEVKSHGLNLFK